jgi:hypothetical protein
MAPASAIFAGQNYRADLDFGNAIVSLSAVIPIETRRQAAARGLAAMVRDALAEPVIGPALGRTRRLALLTMRERFNDRYLLTPKRTSAAFMTVTS